jgi:hypothetical protein
MLAPAAGVAVACRGDGTPEFLAKGGRRFARPRRITRVDHDVEPGLYPAPRQCGAQVAGTAYDGNERLIRWHRYDSCRATTTISGC